MTVPVVTSFTLKFLGEFNKTIAVPIPSYHIQPPHPLQPPGGAAIPTNAHGFPIGGGEWGIRS